MITQDVFENENTDNINYPTNCTRRINIRPARPRSHRDDIEALEFLDVTGRRRWTVRYFIASTRTNDDNRAGNEFYIFYATHVYISYPHARCAIVHISEEGQPDKSNDRTLVALLDMDGRLNVRLIDKLMCYHACAKLDRITLRLFNPPPGRELATGPEAETGRAKHVIYTYHFDGSTAKMIPTGGNPYTLPVRWPGRREPLLALLAPALTRELVLELRGLLTL
jgi:hypothetical protein